MLNKATSQTIVDKWSPILEGINDDYVRETTAVLLENQARHIINEAQRDGVLSEATPGGAATTVGSIGTFQKFAFPIVRRVFPELIANKVVGVQPMQGPVSQIFYLGFDRANKSNSRRETVYSKYNLTYGANDATTQWTGTQSLDTCAATMANLAYSGALSSVITMASATVGGKIASFPTSGTVVGYDVSSGEVIGQFVPYAGGLYATCALALSALSSINNYPNGTIPEINFHIEQQAVTARTRKFRALWTLEAAQDLRAYHNLDLERELTDLLGKEVALEIDRELIEDMRGIAYDISGFGFERSLYDMPNSNNFQGAGSNSVTFNPGSYTYDQVGIPGRPSIAGPGNQGPHRQNVYFVDFASTALTLAPRHVGQAYANLLAVLNFASQDIYKSTYRGAGNYIITSPFVAAILNSASKLEGGVKAGNWEGSLGANINYAGKLQGMFDVYVDPLYPDDEMLMGYKGSSPMDAGFVYAPYIPLQMLPTITDPETFQPRKGLITRYGKAAVSPEARFFRIIRLVGATNYLFRPGVRAGA